MFTTLINGFNRLILQVRAPTGTTESFNTMARLLHQVDIPTKKATFAMACFWAPDSLFGTLKGVIRTRVGYSGGTKVNPSYKSLGDHTEAIDIDYDPNEISYGQLVDVFWKNHDPTARMTRQYTSLIFYHDEEQRELAESSMKEYEKTAKGEVVTKVVPAGEFYEAEDYHQKYRLQQHPWLVEAIGLKPNQMTGSHLAARLNGYVVGCGGVDQFNAEVERLGLDEKSADFVRKLVVKYEGHGLFC